MEELQTGQITQNTGKITKNADFKLTLSLVELPIFQATGFDKLSNACDIRLQTFLEIHSFFLYFIFFKVRFIVHHKPYLHLKYI